MSYGAMRWTRRTPDAERGPRVDHTHKSATGHFIITDTFHEQLEFDDQAVLVSPVVKATSDSCLIHLWVQMIEDEHSRLEFYFTNGSLSKHERRTFIDAIVGKNETDWHLKQIRLGKHPNAGYRLKIVAEAPLIDFFAIDDIEFTSCHQQEIPCGDTGFLCELNPPDMMPGVTAHCINHSQVCDFKYDCWDGRDELNCGACDFEDDYSCGWRSSQEGYYYWSYIAASWLASWPAGPHTDHTLGTDAGHILSLMSEPKSFDKPANLTSPTLPRPLGHTQCHIAFFYYMTGSKLGTLELFVESNDSWHGIYGDRSAWRATPSSANDTRSWRYAIVDLSEQLNKTWSDEETRAHHLLGWNVRFEEYPNGLLTGNDGLAIDDIAFVNCHDEATSGYTCDYRVDLCGWRNENATGMRAWSTRAFASKSHRKGISSHRGHAYFFATVFLNAAEALKSDGQRARMRSPLYTPTLETGRCLSFWYYLNGNGSATLSVQLESGGLKNPKRAPIWTRHSTRTNEWLPIELNVVSRVRFRLVIEALLGATPFTHIAIDGIEFSTRACKVNPIESSILADFEHDMGFLENSLDKKEALNWSPGESSLVRLIIKC